MLIVAFQPERGILGWLSLTVAMVLARGATQDPPFCTAVRLA